MFYPFQQKALLADLSAEQKKEKERKIFFFSKVAENFSRTVFRSPNRRCDKSTTFFNVFLFQNSLKLIKCLL
jgi:hypothetical protein